MAVGFSLTNTINAFLNALRANTSYSAPAATYVQLHTGDPGAAGTTNISVGSTTRVVMTQGAPSAGAIAITGTNPSWTNGGTSETVSHITVWSAVTAGTFSYSIALTTSKTWGSGDILTLTSCGVSVTPAAA